MTGLSLRFVAATASLGTLVPLLALVLFSVALAFVTLAVVALAVVAIGQKLFGHCSCGRGLK